jgi:hypothetical protein
MQKEQQTLSAAVAVLPSRKESRESNYLFFEGFFFRFCTCTCCTRDTLPACESTQEFCLKAQATALSNTQFQAYQAGLCLNNVFSSPSAT